MSGLVQVESRNDVALVICKNKVAEEKVGRELSSTFRRLLSQGKHKTLLVDISRVEYMTSMGISPLFLASHEAKKQGIRFFVCGIRPRVRELLTILKCAITWEVIGDCKEARSALGFD